MNKDIQPIAERQAGIEAIQCYGQPLFTYLVQPPKKYTFEMPKLLTWTIQNCNGKTLNLFAGKTLLNGVDETRIDLNKDVPAHYYMDAYEFVLMAKQNGWKYDTVIFDPPYNLRKSREKYFGVYTSELRKIKTVLPEIINIGGTVISYGYDSVGMGRTRGFVKVHVCLVCHGGDHNDTICLIEKKVQETLCL
jgi:hypothetical protein